MQQIHSFEVPVYNDILNWSWEDFGVLNQKSS